MTDNPTDNPTAHIAQPPDYQEPPPTRTRRHNAQEGQVALIETLLLQGGQALVESIGYDAAEEACHAAALEAYEQFKGEICDAESGKKMALRAYELLWGEPNPDFESVTDG